MKKFLDQDVSGVALEQFKCEVSSLLRLPYTLSVIIIEFLASTKCGLVPYLIGENHVKAKTSQCSSVLGICDTTSKSLYIDRIPSKVSAAPTFLTKNIFDHPLLI